MRHTLLATILVLGAGCQALDHAEGPVRRGDDRYAAADKGGNRSTVGGILNHCSADGDCRKPSDVVKKEMPKTLPEQQSKAAPARQETTDASRVPALSQDVLLVPKMVYIPYAAQAPTSTVRLAGATPVAPPAEEPAAYKAPKPRESVAAIKPLPIDCNQQILDMCRKLNERLEVVERKLGEKPAAAPPLVPSAVPTVIVPNNQPIAPVNAAVPIRRPIFMNNDSLQPCESCPIVPTQN